MLPELPICPCCTAAFLHTVVQSGANLAASQSLLELGKGALLKIVQIERLCQQPVNQQPALPPEPAP